ncbi:MAG: hypothetical protein ACRDHF_11670 [Tepidiformaceae bacterium]
MTEPEPQRARVRIEDPLPEPDPVRTGCLWAGGVLGVIAGVVVTFLAVPSILNFLFPSETIEVGKTFENDKLTMRVESVERAEFLDEFGYAVRLWVDARSSWSPSEENFVLVLDDGTEIRAGNPNLRFPQGEVTIRLEFPAGAEPDLAEPDSLHIEEPPVKFELPAPVTP